MKTLEDRLREICDTEYAAFQSKLTPNVPPDKFIGVRVPVLRNFAKDYAREPECADFMRKLPHGYYDENMLHGLLISGIKDYGECVRQLELFLPYVDNWAVCDIMSPKILGKHKPELLSKIREWIRSPHAYTCRFGIEMLMSWYLDGDFRPEYLELPAAVRSDEYYVRMMVAWFFATALTKQWDAALPYLEKGALDVWTHNKTIQKARESYRVTEERKNYLLALKK